MRRDASQRTHHQIRRESVGLHKTDELCLRTCILPNQNPCGLGPPPGFAALSSPISARVGYYPSWITSYSEVGLSRVKTMSFWHGTKMQMSRRRICVSSGFMRARSHLEGSYTAQLQDPPLLRSIRIKSAPGPESVRHKRFRRHQRPAADRRGFGAEIRGLHRHHAVRSGRGGTVA